MAVVKFTIPNQMVRRRMNVFGTKTRQKSPQWFSEVTVMISNALGHLLPHGLSDTLHSDVSS